MKASELTQEGWYWYRGADQQWAVVRFAGVEDGYFVFSGNDTPFFADTFPGEFVGPLTPPADEREGCGAELAPGQWYTKCGEWEQGAEGPVAFCIECGGDYKRGTCV